MAFRSQDGRVLGFSGIKTRRAFSSSLSVNLAPTWVREAFSTQDRFDVGNRPEVDRPTAD
jgi:hypothetical protein